MPDVNLLAVVAAALSSFALGGLWYSPALFGRRWIALSGAPEQPGHPARVFGISFVFTLVSASAFAIAIGPAPELGRALTAGFVVGAFFVAASFGINYQFADRPFAMWVIDGLYHTVQFTLYGLILGLWH